MNPASLAFWHHQSNLGWDIGSHEFGGFGATLPAEFDVVGAVYYAVAPVGYVYSGTQDTNYSTRKYNSLFAANAAISGVLAAPVVINILGDWSGGPDTTLVDFNLGTTSSTNYILVRCIGDARNNGVWSNSKYRLSISSTTLYAIGIYAAKHLRLDGLQIIKTGINTSGNGYGGISNFSSQEVRISNCILRGTNDVTETAIGIDYAGSGSLKIWNTIIYDFTNSTSPGTIGSSIVITGSGTVEIYSCICISRDTSISRSAGTVVIKNTYSAGLSLGAYSYNGTMTKTTCASSDATGSPGLQNIDHDTATFINVTAGSQDYRLASGSPLMDVGTDTSADTDPLNFTTDIAGKSKL
jgi:hypothetical protein